MGIEQAKNYLIMPSRQKLQSTALERLRGRMFAEPQETLRHTEPHTFTYDEHGAVL